MCKLEREREIRRGKERGNKNVIRNLRTLQIVTHLIGVDGAHRHKTESNDLRESEDKIKEREKEGELAVGKGLEGIRTKSNEY